ncbi:DgyrCDS8221 [Dimorphilus gyrociliatus]|uniref:DgyrCDS8221 n=1 Tax=Dimorphilus gyrociliatus TaxID=2664684 RepID=A0A7I8VTK3_9ANNE|nr:DgyrCDS8221 [Dimorphilus gyrociliatus]
MTSLEFYDYPAYNNNKDKTKEWGTGKVPQKVPLWSEKSPTWHMSGEPIQQNYDVTNLHRSNVRPNDELVPKPEITDLGQEQILRNYPSNHPYASHMSRAQVFPKFTPAPEHETLGFKARLETPRGPEIPASNFKVDVHTKIKGFPRREETQEYLPDSRRTALHWPEGPFDQTVKGYQKQSDIYPTPPTLLVPNMKERYNAKCLTGDMQATPRTANVGKNIEKLQWKTTYDLEHSGVGPSNPMKLDNFEDLRNQRIFGVNSSDLRPISVPTIDRPRPLEGRISRSLTPKPNPQIGYRKAEIDSNYTRKPTLTEREEDRLLNGGKYRNLPVNVVINEKERNFPRKSQKTVRLRNNQIEDNDEELDNNSENGDNVEERELIKLRLEQHDNHQQMEASNRWKDLELQTPAHDVGSLNRKYAGETDKNHPKIFYNHEGTYQKERGALYRTSYEPEKLQGLMDDVKSSERFTVLNSYKGSLDHPTSMNDQMGEAVWNNRTLGSPGSVPQLNGQPTPYEIFSQFKTTRQKQRNEITPIVDECDRRTQEGHLISTESSYGNDFNTAKFLQEKTLPRQNRREPYVLMSLENKNMDNVRNNILTREGSTSNKKVVTFKQPVQIYTSRSDGRNYSANLPLALSSRNMFSSKSSNLVPTNLKTSWQNASAYESQFGMNTERQQYDPRFDWEPGSGTPRPQSRLLQIQNSFSKTDSRKEFHRKFPETNPDLRENIIFGRKHDFSPSGINAQVLRGAQAVF